MSRTRARRARARRHEAALADAARATAAIFGLRRRAMATARYSGSGSGRRGGTALPNEDATINLHARNCNERDENRPRARAKFTIKSLRNSLDSTLVDAAGCVPLNGARARARINATTRQQQIDKNMPTLIAQAGRKRRRPPPRLGSAFFDRVCSENGDVGAQSRAPLIDRANARAPHAEACATVLRPSFFFR